MNRFLLSTATTVIAALLAQGVSANTLYFQMNPNLYHESGVRQAFIFGVAGATGTVTGGSGFSQAFDLGTGGFAVIDLPISDELTPGVVQDKGFRIDSETNLSGYFLNREPFTTDMTYLIDGDKLGDASEGPINYVVAAYNTFGGEQMSVQATQDNTKVTFFAGSGDQFEVMLNQGQTYLYEANVELTGKRITSDKPITVFSGNKCTDVPVSSSACDHIVEQMPNVGLLSNSYLLAQTPRTGESGNVFRVVNAEGIPTEVKVNGVVVATLSEGQFYEGRVSGGIQIDADHKVLVAQYLVGQSEANGESTDPAMTIVPGKDQWLNSYVFSTPSGSAGFPTDFISIIINTTDIASLTVAGILADPMLFSQLGMTTFSFGSIDVSSTEGAFSITAANPFQLLLSGFDDYDSYFTYGGAAFSPGASPPPPPPTGTARLFWDGDGSGNAGNSIVDGGDGVWTAATTNFTEETGATNGPYEPQPETVVFSGAPGLVTVSAAAGEIGVTGMSFTVDGYRLSGDPIRLYGTPMGELEEPANPNAVFNVGDGSAAGAAFVARIDSQLVGDAGLTKIGLGTLVLGAANTYAGGTIIDAGTLVGAADGFGSGAIVNNALLVIDQAMDASMANAISGSGRLNKTGVGALTLTAINSYAGGTGIEAGTLIGSTTSFGSGDIANAGMLIIDEANDSSFGNVISGAGAVTKRGTGGVRLGNVNTYGGGTIIVEGALIGTVSSFGSGGIMTAGALILDQPVNAVFANAISGTGSLTKLGDGAVTLGNANTHGGGTTITGGALIGTATSFGSGGIVNNALLVINQATAASMANAISGSGRLNKNGVGALTLSGVNSYSGGTALNAGTLIGSTTSFGSGAIVNAGILVIDQANDGSLVNAISGAGALVKRGTGGVRLGNVNTYAGGTTISGGALIGTVSSFGGGAIVVTAGSLVLDQPVNAVFANSVSGAGSLVKLGAGAVTLGNVNTYAGGTTITGGALIGTATSFGSGAILDNAQLVIDQATAASMANAINGSGSFNKTGVGTLTLTTGGNLRGATSVDAGRLQVDGNLGQSIVTVRLGATLGGNGTVGGIIVREGGTVAPGSSIGTLNVAGNFAQDPRSTYAVEITAAGAVDKIVATGTATLSPGAILKVSKLDTARYFIGSRYTVLTAAGGVTGTYAVTGDTAISRFANITATYDTRNVYLNAAQTSSFTSVSGLTPNQTAAASGADSAGNGTMYQALAYLQSDAEARAAFDQISGEIHASLRGATFEDSRFVREAVTNHLMSPDEARRGIWFEGYGAWGTRDGDGNAASFDRDIGGFFVGGDIVASETVKAGIVGGYSTAKLRVDDRTSSAETDDYHLAGYLGFESGNFALRSGVAHAWRDVRTYRTVTFNSFSDNLSGSYQTRVFQGFAEAGYKIKAGESVTFEPFGALAFVGVKTDDFKERGGAAALASVDGASDEYLMTTLGGRIEAGLPVGGGNVGISAMAGWRHVGSGDLYTPIRMQFASGMPFDIVGPPIAKDAAALALKLSARLGPKVDFDFGYSGIVGSGLSDHGIRAALRARF